jgi:hypothetical protein
MDPGLPGTLSLIMTVRPAAELLEQMAPLKTELPTIHGDPA